MASIQTLLDDRQTATVELAKAALVEERSLPTAISMFHKREDGGSRANDLVLGTAQAAPCEMRLLALYARVGVLHGMLDGYEIDIAELLKEPPKYCPCGPRGEKGPEGETP